MAGSTKYGRTRKDKGFRIELDSRLYRRTLKIVEQLPRKMQKQVMRSVMGQVGRSSVKSTKSTYNRILRNTTPPKKRVGRKLLKDSIINRVITSKKIGGNVFVVVGPQYPMVPHAHLVESGSYQTDPPTVIAGQRYWETPPYYWTGRMPALAPLRKSFDSLRPMMGGMMYAALRKTFNRKFKKNPNWLRDARAKAKP